MDDAVQGIERPVALLGGRLLYVATRSYGHARLFVVDAASCAIAWASPAYHGAATISGATLRLHGLPPFRIDAHGLPPPAR